MFIGLEDDGIELRVDRFDLADGIFNHFKRRDLLRSNQFRQSHGVIRRQSGGWGGHRYLRYNAGQDLTYSDRPSQTRRRHPQCVATIDTHGTPPTCRPCFALEANSTCCSLTMEDDRAFTAEQLSLQRHSLVPITPVSCRSGSGESRASAARAATDRMTPRRNGMARSKTLRSIGPGSVGP